MLGGKLQGEHHLPGQVHVHLITIPFDELPVANELSDQGDDPAKVLVAGSRGAWARAGSTTFSSGSEDWQ